MMISLIVGIPDCSSSATMRSTLLFIEIFQQLWYVLLWRFAHTFMILVLRWWIVVNIILCTYSLRATNMYFEWFTSISAHYSKTTCQLKQSPFIFCTVSGIICVHTNMPETVNHITNRVHWACMCQCQEKSDCPLCSWLLNCRKYYRGRTAIAKSKTRDLCLVWRQGGTVTW